MLLIPLVSGSLLTAQSTVPRVSLSPLPSQQELADLEARVQQNPDDVDSRVKLLQRYWSAASAFSDAPGRRIARLQHILYLIEHHPEAPAIGSPVAYVYRANGPYANAADHDAARGGWLAAVQAHPSDAAVVVNAARFLSVEDKNDAEDVLQRAVAADPENREVAATLGFVYAMEILGLDSLALGAQPSEGGIALNAHAIAELEQSSNAVVLAAAGTALPNLAAKMSGSRQADPKVFDLAASLSARARELAPSDRDIQGPMPLLRYFAAAQENAKAESPAAVSPAGVMLSGPARIRFSGNVQAAKLIRKNEPQYPEVARQAGISGDVRLSVTIGRDGTIQHVQLVSGHPLLVQAAIQAAETWLYEPTLLNGVPTEVTMEVTVSFPGN